MPVARCNGARGGGGLSPLREQRAGAAWSGAWCRAEKSCKGGPRARAGPRSVCVCVCGVCARAPVPGSALVTGTAAARAAALATAPLPKPMAGGSCQRRGRWRPLTPGLRRTKGGSERRGSERRGRRAGRKEERWGLLCLLPAAAPSALPGTGFSTHPPPRTLLCAPAFYQGPHPALRPQAGSRPPGRA